jgi:hypothetical protein
MIVSSLIPEDVGFIFMYDLRCTVFDVLQTYIVHLTPYISQLTERLFLPVL